MNVRISWDGPEVTTRTRDAAISGLLKGAEHLLGESTKVVPIEEGTLSRSGVTSVDEGNLTAAVSYDTVYAARQHEELTWRHDAGRTAKYLERPLNEQSATIQRIIAGEIGQALS